MAERLENGAPTRRSAGDGPKSSVALVLGIGKSGVMMAEKKATKKKAAASAAETKTAKKKATKAKKTTRRTPKKKAAENARMKLFWGVFNHSMKEVAKYDYSQKKQAEARAKELAANSKTPYFVQKVKEPVVEEQET